MSRARMNIHYVRTICWSAQCRCFTILQLFGLSGGSHNKNWHSNEYIQWLLSQKINSSFGQMLKCQIRAKLIKNVCIPERRMTFILHEAANFRQVYGSMSFNWLEKVETNHPVIPHVCFLDRATLYEPTNNNNQRE